MDISSNLNVTKTVTKFVVARCVGMVVATIVKNSIPVDTRTEKVQVFIGAHVLGAMVGEIASVYTNHKIDQMAEWLTEAKEQPVAK